MARKLKIFRTSVGFFDLAIAAPSMKAAADAWGTKIEDFRRGFARQTDDPEIVAATMAQPGVVLKRPVGSSGPFTKHAELPKHPPERRERRDAKSRPKTKARSTRKRDHKADREAALAFEREQKRRERERQKQEAAREKERKRREQAVAQVERALKQAAQQHEARAKKIDRQRAALEKQVEAEEARWAKQKRKLEDALRRARG